MNILNMTLGKALYIIAFIVLNIIIYKLIYYIINNDLTEGQQVGLYLALIISYAIIIAPLIIYILDNYDKKLKDLF